MRRGLRSHVLGTTPQVAMSEPPQLSQSARPHHQHHHTTSETSPTSPTQRPHRSMGRHLSGLTCADQVFSIFGPCVRRASIRFHRRKRSRPRSNASTRVRSSEEHALCRAPPGIGGWTRKRKFVICTRCHAEIGKRLMNPGWR